MQYPCYMYHKETGAKLFKTEEEFKEGGKGHVDSPANFTKNLIDALGINKEEESIEKPEMVKVAKNIKKKTTKKGK